ncbi:hypothetical protein M5U04_18845 [Xenorhabdus sp. XENO-1]|uniref:hypothetical protein n=1 Tax=Xenorhabdus bovienii TaxID=40576 RepID=UPI0020CA3FCF|nr:hypothetical protein [Xenorhabdus bovienii]MCP9270083.1 hypothetical protein [Xenorhabdus bovienii subsp. africana]
MSFGQNCEQYWNHANWVPVKVLIDEWCKSDQACKEAKRMAILSACEKGLVCYMRSDGKTWDDPINELYGRDILLIDKESFLEWVSQFNDPAAPTPKITTREKNNLHAVIGSLLLLLLKEKENWNQSSVILEINNILGNVEPFSERNLQKIFPLAKESLKEKGHDFNKLITKLKNVNSPF